MKEDKLYDIVIGVLLGDASIQKNTSKSQEKWRLKFSQQLRHKQYLFHLHTVFSDYVKANPSYNEKRKMFSFQTLFDAHFNTFADMFIDEYGKKRVPQCFKNIRLSPITLAYWFMDDGGSNSYNPRKGILFSTHCFIESGVKMLSENLNHYYNINSWVKLNKGKHVIAISESESQRFAKHFLPFLHESMYYKLSFTT